MVEAYLARLRERYGHLDIESLLPLDSQQEQIPVGVREVFVAQTVRLIATDPAAPLDLPAWCHLTGHTYLGTVDGQQRSTYAIYTAAAPTATHPNRPWHAPPAAP